MMETMTDFLEKAMKASCMTEAGYKCVDYYNALEEGKKMPFLWALKNKDYAVYRWTLWALDKEEE